MFSEGIFLKNKQTLYQLSAAEKQTMANVMTEIDYFSWFCGGVEGILCLPWCWLELHGWHVQHDFPYMVRSSELLAL